MKILDTFADIILNEVVVAIVSSSEFLSKEPATATKRRTHGTRIQQVEAFATQSPLLAGSCVRYQSIHHRRLS